MVDLKKREDDSECIYRLRMITINTKRRIWIVSSTPDVCTSTNHFFLVKLHTHLVAMTIWWNKMDNSVCFLVVHCTTNSVRRTRGDVTSIQGCRRIANSQARTPRWPLLYPGTDSVINISAASANINMRHRLSIILAKISRQPSRIRTAY